VDAIEGGQRTIDLRDLHRNVAAQQVAPTGAVIALITKPCNLKVANTWDEVEREFIPRPEIVNDRCDSGLHELADLVDLRLLGLRQHLKGLVEIAVRLRYYDRLLCFLSLCV